MKPCGGFLVALSSRIHVRVSMWMLPQMTSHLWFLVLSGLVSFRLGLEDVFFSPQDQTVTEGAGVFLRCVSGESLSPAGISWFKDGKMVTRGRQIQGEYGGGNQKKTSGTLHLFNVTLEDEGFYSCVTHNPLLNITKKSHAAKLTVHAVPRRLRIQRGPNNITVAVGTEVSMNCTVGGFPVPMVHWFKDGRLLATGAVSFSLQNNGQLLTVRNVTKEHEGLYHCEASNLKETIKSQTAFLMIADMDWSFVRQPTNLTVKRGDNATVTCRPPRSSPAAQVSWFKDNQLLSHTPRVAVLSSGDLFFHGVQEHDSGSYFCRASNTHLQRFLSSRRAALTVLAPPSVNVWPQVVTVAVGAQVELECQVSGLPLPSISWLKRGQSKQTGGRLAMGRRNATLRIQSVRSYDEGAYVCEASNPLGRSRGTATLRVAVSPVIETFVAQVSSRIGASVVLPCKAVGILPITYTWSRAEPHSAVSPTHSIHTDAADHPADEDQQTRQLSSAKSKPSDSRTERLVRATRPPSLHAQAHNEAACSSPPCDATTDTSTGSTGLRRPVAEFKVHPESLNGASQHQQTSPTNTPTQASVTQMQPPMLPPPPHPNFQSVALSTITPVGSDSERPVALSQTSVLHTEAVTSLQYLHSDNQSQSRVQFQHQVHDKLPTDSDSDDSIVAANNLSHTETSHFGPFTQLHSPQSRSHQLVTESQLHQSHREPTSAQTVQTKLQHPGEPRHRGSPQPSPPDASVTPTLYPQPPFNELSVTRRYFPSTQPSSITEPPTRPEPPSPPTQQPPRSTLRPEIPVNVSLSNATQSATEWQKRNTSQSPMTSNDPRGTQQAPSWLPAMEKHDIPIVVGVGVSLAFIFITVTFYSVVQKNEPAPTSRAAQRNLGVPARHAERRAAERAYENRAFEDDDCVAVIEQSPNTSDTRARPPGPSLVTVQLEPTSEDGQPAVDGHSVTVETYPEPILDTKIDSSPEDEKGCSLSQPSIQLRCAEDWSSSRGDDHSPCHDALPPPSPLPSPSPPFRRDEALRSSLTLRSAAEPCAAPLHHSLSVCHGNPPLLVSHHLSLGLTTVAVDVHFYPASTASVATSSSVSSSTTVTAPVFSPPLVNRQDNEPAARVHQCK